MTGRQGLPKPEGFRWGCGEHVRKTKGSDWSGWVVGFYSTSLTPEGYAIESDRHPGTVQIYPVTALEKADG